MSGAERLSAAAQELVKAAIDTTNTTSIALSKEAVAELKHIHSELKQTQTATQAGIKQAQSSFDKINNVLESKLDALAATMTRAHAHAAAQARVQALQWALQNAVTGEFDYYDADSRCMRKSSNTAKLVLQYAMKGQETILAKGSLIRDGNTNYCRTEAEKEQKLKPLRQEFCVALCEQLHGISGIKPTQVLNSEGRWVVGLP